MVDQEEIREPFEYLSEEDALLDDGLLSKSQRMYRRSYNRLIKKGFLSTLTYQEYKVWRLFANTRLSINEIAKELHLNISMVKEYIQQVVNKFKEELAVERDWKKPVEQKYTKAGFKKYLQEKEIDDPVYKNSRKVDKLFKERLKLHQKEVDDFIKKHSLKPRLGEDDLSENN